MRFDDISEGVAGPKNCWPGHRKVGTQPGTGKNAGKRVNKCKKIGEGLGDEVNPADVGEYDREGEMAMGQLQTAEDAAAELRSILDADENLPEWVQTKITKAVDYLDTARDYMKGKDEQGVAEGHADQQRKIFKKNGKPVGEVGIDRESSPGVGQWYMKCYAYDIDNSGYDSYEEAVEELKYCLKQGVAEGAMPASVIKSKQRYAEMTPAEFAKAHADKSDEELKAMAWRHGYGKNSTHYVNKRNKGKESVAEGLNEFAPAGSGNGTPPRGPKTPGNDPWGGNDGAGDDPYGRPEPEYYSRSIDFFGQFEADHFDKEDFDKATGTFKGYWDYDGKLKQIAYFKFDDPQQAARDFNDSPGMGWYYEPVDESKLKEFAPTGSDDNGDDGFSEETLKRLAAQWYNGDEDPRAERTLMAAGWEIGQDEGYDDEPGVFVVRAGDVNGNSYISWPAHELKQSVAEVRSALSQAVKEAGWGRRSSYYNPMDQERREQDAMDYSKRAFKRAELQHELGHEDDPNFERNLRQQQIDRDRGPWYIRIDGKIYRQKGQPKSFDWKRGANNYALAMVKNNPGLQGKIMLSKSAEDR